MWGMLNLNFQEQRKKSDPMMFPETQFQDVIDRILMFWQSYESSLQ